MKGRKGSDSTGSSSGSAERKGGDRGDRSKFGKESAKQKKKGKFDINKVRCYNCNDKGHF
jgi:hypothetical protein